MNNKGNEMDEAISRRAAINAAIKGADPYYADSIEAEINKVSPMEPESAQWVQMLINRRMYKCSNCQVAWNKRLVFDDEGYSKNIFMKYCPCCGRKMQTEVDYE